MPPNRPGDALGMVWVASFQTPAADGEAKLPEPFFPGRGFDPSPGPEVPHRWLLQTVPASRPAGPGEGASAAH